MRAYGAKITPDIVFNFCVFQAGSFEDQTFQGRISLTAGYVFCALREKIHETVMW
jgi:hypothetical protein